MFVITFYSILIFSLLLLYRFLMGASCGSSIRREDREAYEQYKEGYKQLGLRANHAYSVLDVQDVNGYRY